MWGLWGLLVGVGMLLVDDGRLEAQRPDLTLPDTIGRLQVRLRQAVTAGDSLQILLALETWHTVRHRRDSATIDTLRQRPRLRTCPAFSSIRLPCPVLYLGTGPGWDTDGNLRYSIPQIGIGFTLFTFGRKGP